MLFRSMMSDYAEPMIEAKHYLKAMEDALNVGNVDAARLCAAMIKQNMDYIIDYCISKENV